MDFSKYYNELSTQRKKLETAFPSGFCYIVSVDNLGRNITAGSVSQVSVQLAAKALLDSTHELMEPDDVLAHEAAELERRRGIAKDDGAAIKRRVRSMLGDNR